MKKSVILSASFLFGITYSIFIIRYIFQVGELMWLDIPTAVIYPHVFFAVLATIMNGAAFLSKSKKALLLCAGFYTASAISFPPFHIFVVVPMLLTLASLGFNIKDYKLKKQLC